MKGYLLSLRPTPASTGALPAWQQRAAEAVGTAIEFWGFKANHGRVWTVLYLANEPLRASELQTLLGMSKGAVSMITRELEQWGVIRRVRPSGSTAWHFEAEREIFRMIRHVIEEREARIITRIEADLAEAELQARAARVDAATLERIRKLRALSHRMSQAVEAFVRTAKLDVGGLSNLLLRGRAK